MKETYTAEQKLTKLLELAKLAFGHHQAVLNHQTAERNSIKEVLMFAVEHDISRDDVKEAFVKAGYKPQTAAVYASQVDSIQQDPEARKEMLSAQSFGKAAKRATENRINKMPVRYAVLMLKNAFRTAARLAYKVGWTLEESVEEFKEAYAKEAK